MNTHEANMLKQISLNQCFNKPRIEPETTFDDDDDADMSVDDQ